MITSAGGADSHADPVPLEWEGKCVAILLQLLNLGANVGHELHRCLLLHIVLRAGI